MNFGIFIVLRHLLIVERRNVLITGATGFVGSQLCKRLMNSGTRIFAISRYQDIVEKLDSAVEPIIGDLCDHSFIESINIPFNTVFHCAAELSDKNKMKELHIDATSQLVRQVASDTTH